MKPRVTLKPLPQSCLRRRRAGWAFIKSRSELELGERVEPGRQDLIRPQNRSFGSTPSGGVSLSAAVTHCHTWSGSKEINIYYLTVSVGQTSGTASLGPLGRGFPPGCQVTCQPGPGFHPKAQERKDPFPRSVVTVLRAVSLRSSVLCLRQAGGLRSSPAAGKRPSSFHAAGLSTWELVSSKSAS